MLPLKTNSGIQCHERDVARLTPVMYRLQSEPAFTMEFKCVTNVIVHNDIVG